MENVAYGKQIVYFYRQKILNCIRQYNLYLRTFFQNNFTHLKKKLLKKL